MKITPETMTITDYLGKAFDCNCGRTHQTQLQYIDISAGALYNVPALVRRLGASRPMVVCDCNTAPVAGDLLRQLLADAGLEVRFHCFPQQNLVPDEAALGELVMALPPQVDLLIAVGTGTLNDLCKYLSFQVKLPYIVVGTAPSMDGYASVGAALITANLKTTYDTHVPLAIVGDLNVLKAAPMEMISAGLADILGKYTCLVDWHLAHLVTGEYYCPQIVSMVRESIRRVVENAEGVQRRDPDAIAAVMEALILTGIAMSFVGNSRPASGSEHHISHFWEMRFLFEGRPAVLHGTKVGIGTVLCCQLYQLLRQRAPDFAHARAAATTFDRAAWEEKMNAVYLKAADGVIALEHKTGKNGVVAHAGRIAAIEQNWDAICGLIDNELPPTPQVAALLTSLDAPTLPAQLGIDHTTVADSIVAAKETRDRYTVLQLLWDLGLLDEAAEQAAAWLDKQ